MKKVYLMMSCAWIALSASAQITLDKPVAKPATDITSNSFTANWEPLAGAENYGLYVYTKEVAPADGEYTLMDENFSGITDGSIIEPAGGEENIVFLDELGFSDYYGWWSYAYPTWIGGMIDGLLYSPYMDLSNDGGRYKLIITVYCNRDDVIRVESHGTGEKVVKKFTCPTGNEATGKYTGTLEFDNGCQGLFFTIINETAEIGTPDYVDRVQVVQTLKKGDAIYTQVTCNETLEAESDWGEAVTSDAVTNLYYAYGATELYYDLQAMAYDFSAPRGSIPYTPVYSPFSDKVRVDLTSKQSEVLGIEHVTVNTASASERRAIYNMAGQQVSKTARGLYIIKDGNKTKKVFTK